MFKRLSFLFLILFFVISTRPAFAVSANITAYSSSPEVIKESNRSALKFPVNFTITNGDVGATYYYVFSATISDPYNSVDTQSGSNYLSSTSQPDSKYPTVVLGAGGSASVTGNAKINLITNASSGGYTLSNFIVTIYSTANTSQSAVSNAISPSLTFAITTPTPTPSSTPTPTPTSAVTPTPTLAPTPTEIPLPTIAPTVAPTISSVTSTQITPTPKVEEKETGKTNILPILFIIAGILLCFVPLVLSRPDIFNISKIKRIFKKKQHSVQYQEPPQEPPQDIPEIR